MADKPQPFVPGRIPDYEVAEFRKKLVDIYETEPDLADRYDQMVKLVGAGVSPDTAAPACGIFHEWENEQWLLDMVEAAWARHKAAVMMNVGRHLAGIDKSGPNATLAALFLKAHGNWNEKSAEGWHQNIRIQPVVIKGAGIAHSPDQNYAEYYAKRQERALKDAADAVKRHETDSAALKDDETEPETV